MWKTIRRISFFKNKYYYAQVYTAFSQTRMHTQPAFLSIKHSNSSIRIGKNT
jgi:hypothetical protein